MVDRIGDKRGNLIKYSFDNKTNKALTYFWTGFTIYTLSFSILGTTQVNYKIFQGIQIIGIFLFVPAAITLINWKFDNNYLKSVFNFYCLWSFIVIFRGFQFEYEFLKQMLFSATVGIFLYFVPLILLFTKNISYFKKVFNVIVILGVFYIFYDILFYRVIIMGISRHRVPTATIETFVQLLSIPSGFLLLTYKYHSGKRNIIALFIIILTFLLVLIRARRGLMFVSTSILIFSYFIYYYAHKAKLVIFLFSLLLILLIYFGGAKIYNENRKGIFGLITERLDENTRTGVEVFFYLDMNTVDWIVGRGINGQYYCPGIDEFEGSETVYRSVIETGYLQIILKGGIVSLGLFLLIAIPAIFKGLFYSKNLLSKAAAIWIFLFIIYLYPITINFFSLNYLLIWLSIGICYDSNIRLKSDEDIKSELV